jgi:hypothetical protein
VDKNNFISLLNRYSRSTVSEALEILALKQKYPYSQLLHALSAKVSKDHGFSTQQQELQLAAVYASDRAALKEILTATHDDESETISKARVEERPRTSTTKVEFSVPQGIAADTGLDLAETVINDLKELSRSRRDFELMFSDGDHEPVTEKISGVETNDQATEEEPKKSKKQRIIELARAIESNPAEDIKSDHKKRNHTTEVLIEEIVSSKKEIDPETEEQKKQIQIIDQFIKAQPSISNNKDKSLPEPTGDLASSIKSGEFGDNIVSETLVDTLLKQGKRDKAIEVLKKLIWKFPQKKAYFAAQIEELKK